MSNQVINKIKNKIIDKLVIINKTIIINKLKILNNLNKSTFINIKFNYSK